MWVSKAMAAGTDAAATMAEAPSAWEAFALNMLLIMV